MDTSNSGALHLVVRYEDKAAKNEAVIRSMAEFFGMPFLRTTQPDLQQNPTCSPEQKRIAIVKITSWLDDIGPRDLRRIFSRVSEVNQWFGYRWPEESDFLEFETQGDVSLTRSPAAELQFAVAYGAEAR